MTAVALEQWPEAVTLVDGVAVALCGEDVTVTFPASADGPEQVRRVPGATQRQLRWLYENEGHPLIEQVAEK